MSRDKIIRKEKEKERGGREDREKISRGRYNRETMERRADAREGNERRETVTEPEKKQKEGAKYPIIFNFSHMFRILINFLPLWQCPDFLSILKHPTYQ